MLRAFVGVLCLCWNTVFMLGVLCLCYWSLTPSSLTTPVHNTKAKKEYTLHTKSRLSADFKHWHGTFFRKTCRNVSSRMWGFKCVQKKGYKNDFYRKPAETRSRVKKPRALSIQKVESTWVFNPSPSSCLPAGDHPASHFCTNSKLLLMPVPAGSGMDVPCNPIAENRLA
jgi:hypothetical protein